MASNNYTSANVVPAADTFREWVDLTNRITYDMEKVVVTVAANTQGARTSGNATVNGFFSANTVIVDQFLRGGKSTGSVYGTASVSANLVISTNTVAQSIIHAQANIMHSGTTLVTGANVDVNAASGTFTSNAGLNVFNTPMDINANMDIDNACTHITSTNTVIENGNTNITSNVNIDAASIDINDGVLHAGATSINIDSTAVTFTTAAGTNIFNTPLDINANMDVDNTLNHITSTNTAIDGGILNIESNTYVGSNTLTVNGTSFGISSNVAINASAMFFASNAALNIFNTPMDINANVNIDTILFDVTTTGNTNISTGSSGIHIDGAIANIVSTTMNIHGTSLDINSDTNIDGNITTTADATIGNAGTDSLTVNANTVLNDELKVVKDADFDAAVNVDGATTLNGAVTLGNATGDDLTFTGRSSSGITPKANGTHSLGTSTLRWNGQFDDLVADDLNVDTNGTINNNLTVNQDFTVNTALTAVMSGSTRIVTIGAGTTADDRILIKSRVNHNLIPFSNNILLGNTTGRWIVTGKTGSFSSTLGATGKITGGADIEGSGEVKGATLVSTSTLTSGGLATFNAGSVTSGIANVAQFNATGPSSFSQDVNVSANTESGNTQVTGVFGSTGLATLGSGLGVTGTSTLQALNANNTAIAGELGVTGNVDFDSNLNVDGNIVVDGTSTLGASASNLITLNGRIHSDVIPQTNGNDLGSTSKRWETFATTVNTTGDITAGGDVDVSGETNTSTLLVNSTSAFKNDSTWSRTGTTGDLTITANTTQHNMGIGGIVCANLVVSGTATLPSDTSLTLSTISGKVFNVADTINLGTGANAVTQVIFGSGAGSGTTANIIFTDAEFSSTFVPRVDNAIDLGTATKRFRTGLYGTSVKVGTGSSYVEIKSDGSVNANNVYATDDLVGKSSSDQQLKENVLTIDTALNKLEHIGGYSFKWNDNIGDFRAQTNDYGVIAQEIENILPDAVSINGRGYKTVNYNALIPLLIQAVKELSAKVDYYMQTEGEEDDG